MSGADILLDRPPGGWSDLVTNQSLDLRFAAFEARMDSRFADVDHHFERFEFQLLAMVDRRLRQQAWLTISSIIAAIGIFGALLRV